VRLCVFAVCVVVACALTGSAVCAEDGKGGCVPGLASCCFMGVPGGQIQNSGVKIPGRSWARILVIPAIIDGFKAYKGETAEEYLGIGSLPATTEGDGGVGKALMSCCWVGVPAGQLMNSGESVPARAWLKAVPYVGTAVSIYDGYKAFQGETMSEYVGIE